MVRGAVEAGTPLVIPSGVLAQVWRDGSRQARLAALVRSTATHIEVLDEPTAKAAGVLCGRSGSADVVDAAVVLAAKARGAVVVTTDVGDLRRFNAGVDIEGVVATSN
ncbi:MAG: twitching motility protein PilT [Actinomycetota bacterium]|nr:twitching motility protein PilT [Actinomycetota bacterium]